MKSIDELSLNGKRVLIRCDLDVPLNNAGEVADDHRLEAAAETISFAQQAGASVIVLGHLGRPKGKRDAKLSLKPVADRLRLIMKSDVRFSPDCVGPEATQAAGALARGGILVLENVRFHGEEEKNDPSFAKELASLGSVYVNNAFATAHRAHASCAAITEFVSEKAAGFTLKRELDFFSRALEHPKRPLVAIFGGAKVSTKMKALKFAGAKADRVIVGGAMANTFFAAQGLKLGASLFEPDFVDEAKDTEAWLRSQGTRLLLPVDVVVAEEMKEGAPTQVVAIDKIPHAMKALDIGPASLELFRGEGLEGAATAVWNGPMGAFEIDTFSAGTYGLIDALVQAPCLKVAGGGDTDLALERRGAMDKMDFVSTGGGAFLTLLEGEPLPAVEALKK